MLNNSYVTKNISLRKDLQLQKTNTNGCNFSKIVNQIMNKVKNKHVLSPQKVQETNGTIWIGKETKPRTNIPNIKPDCLVFNKLADFFFHQQQ